MTFRLNEGITNVNDMHLEQEGDEEVLQHVFLGKVPIMLRSTYCVLSAISTNEVTNFGECPYDQVRNSIFI
jgi:DNA-directed RNA polymerase II subunit RPB2